MKPVAFISIITLFTLFCNYSSSAQYVDAEYKTSAAREYINFDTAQTISDIIPKARKYKSSALLQMQLVGNAKEVKLTVFDYTDMTSINNGIMQIWGTRKDVSFKIQRGHTIAAKAVTYSILNMLKQSAMEEISYKPAHYKKDHLKMSEVSGDEALVISFLKYSLFLDPENNLKRADDYFQFFYNNKGDCVRSVHEGRQFRYFYKYDTQNNWTQRLMWDSDDGIIQKIDRKIIYE